MIFIRVGDVDVGQAKYQASIVCDIYHLFFGGSLGVRQVMPDGDDTMIARREGRQTRRSVRGIRWLVMICVKVSIIDDPGAPARVGVFKATGEVIGGISNS